MIFFLQDISKELTQKQLRNIQLDTYIENVIMFSQKNLIHFCLPFLAQELWNVIYTWITTIPNI